MDPAHKRGGASHMTRPNVKTAAKAHKQTYRGKPVFILHDPLLLGWKAEADKQNASAASLDVSENAIVLGSAWIKIAVVRAGDGERGEPLLPNFGRRLGHPRLTAEKINGITLFGGQRQHHLARFDAGKTVSQGM